jgi:predicted nucleic acid-binding Zn ribbon protein
MSGDLVALLAGTLLAVGALAYVLYPLFFHVRDRVASPPRARSHADDSAIVALREIEFDRATGKLSEPDYAELRAAYGERALSEMRADRTAAPDAGPIDGIEARVRAYRATHRDCPTCGLRPEPDAVYCSTCGAFLDSTCPVCSARIAEPGATFCSSCGVSLSPLSSRA